LNVIPAWRTTAPFKEFDGPKSQFPANTSLVYSEFFSGLRSYRADYSARAGRHPVNVTKGSALPPDDDSLKAYVCYEFGFGLMASWKNKIAGIVAIACKKYFRFSGPKTASHSIEYQFIYGGFGNLP